MVATATRGEEVPGSARSRGFPLPWLAFALAFFALVLVPPVRGNPGLVRTFLGVGGVLLAWEALVWFSAKRRGRRLAFEFIRPHKSHYVQACVQISIYAYWGWYWPKVYESASLIVAQLFFIYLFDALVSWSRGRSWRIGAGPVPIILSTNLFLWFKPDWFVFQFLMIATCALGKEFLKWNRDGRRTHIFNPSAFGLSIFSLVLIVTGTTQYTWGLEVATTLGFPPHIYLWIFLIGLVVQYLFSVTLMTVSAVIALCLLNLVYTGSTGLYHFVDTNIPIAVFLGLHLLVTDPATSPRTNVGRIVFGGLYGVANFVLYAILGKLGVPDFYDKLLPVPLLNLMVPLIDRLAGVGLLGRYNRWEAAFQPRKLNLVHMGIWVALFASMLATGFVEGPHKGASIAFWKQAYEEGKPTAGKNLFKMVGSQAEQGSPSACNDLGVMYMEGELVGRNRAAAAQYFARACKLGDADGCSNLATQYLFLREARSRKDLERALERLEQECGEGVDGRGCYLLGLAHETGQGRAQDEVRALELYGRAFDLGNLDACKALARIRMSHDTTAGDLTRIARELERACDDGDGESCAYLGYLHAGDHGLRRDLLRARELLARSCELGFAIGCSALDHAELPPFSVPLPTLAPAWRSGLFVPGSIGRISALR